MRQRLQPDSGQLRQANLALNYEGFPLWVFAACQNGAVRRRGPRFSGNSSDARRLNRLPIRYSLDLFALPFGLSLVQFWRLGFQPGLERVDLRLPFLSG